MAGSSVSPKPDPWDPPRANATQAAGTGAALAGAVLIAGDKDPGNIDQAIALLPDPHQAFASAAHVLGLQFNQTDAFSWGFILVVLGVALNLISLWLRYRWATWVKPLWDEQIPRLESEAELGRKLKGAAPAASPAKAQGSGGAA